MKYNLGIVQTFVFILLSLISCKKEEKPTLATLSATNVTGTTATGGGNIIDEGTGTVIARGVCWSTAITPTISDSKTSDGAGVGTFTSNITGLNGATTYYVRAYATNSAGIAYGMAMSFTTLGQAPSPTTIAASSITTISAILNGNVKANYLSTTVTFEYGTTTSYGQTVTASQSPITGNAFIPVNANIVGLTAGTTCHFRVKAVNSLGTTYGEDLTFTTLGQVPIAATLAATNKTTVEAQLNGTVNANYLSTVVTFEYGTTTDYGTNIAAKQSPVTGNTVTNVSADITGLTDAIIYHFRVKAVNSLGTSYGSDLTFTTTSSNTLTDVDGNTYNKVTIGNQVWMKENLKTTKYSNGDLIGTTNPVSLDISAESAPKYQWAYNGLESNVTIYGRLYTWYAATDSRNICPIGWHLPSDAEWHTMILTIDPNATFLTDESTSAGGKMKETGTAHWIAPNVGATNSSGFTGLPGGARAENGTVGAIGEYGYWQTSTEVDVATEWGRDLDRGDAKERRIAYAKKYGFSIRCLKDN